MSQLDLPERPAAVSPKKSSWIGQLIHLIAILAVSLVGLTLTSADPVLTALVFALVAAAWWVGWLRLRFALAVACLAGVIGSSLLVAQSPYPLLWIVSSVVTGGFGAWLSERHAREDDFFFLPLGVGITAFLALCTAAFALGLINPPDDFRNWMEFWLATIEQTANQRAEIQLDAHAWTSVRAIWPSFFLSMLMVFWAPALWLGGRLARRATRRLHPIRSRISRFRMRQPYIFLLICALILEILDSLSGWLAWSWIARPMLTVVLIAGLMQGLGVLGFVRRRRRPASSRPSWGLMLLLAAVILIPALGLILAFAISLLGLTDVWFDYRRLEGGRPRHDAEG